MGSIQMTAMSPEADEVLRMDWFEVAALAVLEQPSRRSTAKVEILPAGQLEDIRRRVVVVEDAVAWGFLSLTLLQKDPPRSISMIPPQSCDLEICTHVSFRLSLKT
jgi:hypothetical protein